MQGSRHRPFTAALTVALACLAPRAAASGLDAPLVGSGQSSPTACDPAAVYWNPAQLACLSRPEVLAGAGIVIGSLQYQRERRATYQTPDTLQFRLPLSPANVAHDKTGLAPEVGATPVAPIGDLFLAVPAIPGRLVLGLGVYVPYAAALRFPAQGAQRWQMQQALLVAANVTASAGVRVTPRLSMGVGISYVIGLAEIRKLQDFAALDDFSRGFASLGQANDFGHDAPPGVRELDTLSRPFTLTQAISHGVSFNAGATFRPTDALTLSLTYQHGSEMHYKGRFALDMSHDFFTRDLAPVGIRYKPVVRGDGELSFSLPRRITAGIAYQATRWLRLDGFVSYVSYADVDAFTVKVTSPDLAQPKLGIGDRTLVKLPRDWNDTIAIEGSARLRVSERLLLSGTLGYQSPASPSSTIDVASPDGHRLIGAVGGALAVGTRLSLLGDLRLAGMLPRTVTDSTHDLGNGTYRMLIATAAGHIRWRF